MPTTTAQCLYSCRQFNPPGDITAAADHLEAVYRKELPRLLSPKMTADEKKAMTALVNRSLKEKLSVVFRTAGELSKNECRLTFS